MIIILLVERRMRTMSDELDVLHKGHGVRMGKGQRP